MEEIKLEKPGAGIPFSERILANIFIRILSLKLDNDKILIKFNSEFNQIKELIREVSSDNRERKVLIKRIRGIEDSSRYWSINMTIDHLNIVNFSIIDLLKSLSNNNKFNKAASIADLKPREDSNEKVELIFDEVKLVFNDLIENNSLNSRLKFKHPWFSNLNARQWALLAGMHMQIHKKQIILILTELKLIN